MSAHVVQMIVPRAREVVTTLRSQVAITDGTLERLPGIIAQADDQAGTIDLVNIVGEVSEETGGLADLIRALANLSEAADNGFLPPSEITRLEGLVTDAFGPLRDSIGDGIGAYGTHAELIAAIHLGLVVPNELDQASYDLAYGIANGEFNLEDSIVGGRQFPDGTIWNGGGTIDGVEHIGGGAVLGPDGRYYPIVIPIETDANGNRYTAGLDGEDGWTTIGHADGTTQFTPGLTDGQRLLVGVAVGTGLDIPATTNDDTLPGIIYRDGLPPVLTQVPETYDAVDFSGIQEYTEGVGVPSAVGGAFDLGIQGVQGVTTFNNLGQNDDRAYEVTFEQHESGAIRATVTTHSVGVDGRGNPHLRADHVYVTPDHELAQVPANYRPPEHPVADQGGVLTSVPVGDVRPTAEIHHRPELLGDGPIDIQTDHLLDV